MLRFLRVLTLFLVAFLSFDRVSCAGDFTSCVGSMTYVECDAGYYLSDCGSYRDGRTITRPAAGNSCVACPAATNRAYYECSGGAVCPKNAMSTIEFTVSTTSLTANTTVSFKISAAGTYYINWGDNSTIQKIEKTNTTDTTYSHTYTTAGRKSIGITGQATAYNTTTTTAAISFASQSWVAGISGSLGAIFGTLSDGTQPRFYRTFYNNTNLAGTIPSTLFSDISGAPASHMFAGLFEKDAKITAIGSDLFSGITSASANLFQSTFNGCTGITAIPDGLFSNISGSLYTSLFDHTFYGCTGITSIPENLFGALSGTLGSYTFRNMFNGCTALTGRSAKIGGQYVYKIWSSATATQVGGMYTNATRLADYPCIPTTYGGAGTGACIDISYDAGGGTGNPPTEPIVCVFGQPCPAPENTYTYAGGRFTQWLRRIDGDPYDLDLSPGEDILSKLTSTDIKGHEKITLTASWSTSLYTVTLDNTYNGGGRGTTEVYTTSGDVFYSDALGTSAIRGIDLPTKMNATYMGHFTTRGVSDGVQCIDASGAFTFNRGCEISADTIWYAGYMCAPGWTDAGTVISEICSKNITVNLDNRYATKKGTEVLYARAGSGEVFFDENHTNVMPYITIPENVPVFTFDANGGTVDLSSFAEDPNIARVAENSLTFLPVAFTGFYSEKSGGTQYIDATGALTEAGMVAIAKSTGNLTWYAQWNTYANIYPMPTPVRDGYMFGQWVGTYDIDGRTVTISGWPGQRVTVPTSVDFVINWTPKCNEITLNPNAGTAGSTTTLYKLTDSDPWYIDSECSAQLKDLSSVIPSRVGYLFRGFYPQSNEEEFEGDIAADYETSIPAVITSDMIMPEWNTTSASTLYASWVKECDVPDNGKCSVSIGPGGQIVDYTTSCAVGYTLGNEDTATPVCTANTYNVRYMSNATGATGTMSDELHTYGVAQNLTPNAFTNGTKRFLGWSMNSAATEPEYSDGESVINLSDGDNIRLFAVWGDCTPCAAGTGATCELSAPLGVCTYVGACQPGYGNLVGGDTTTPSCTANTYTVSFNANGGTGGQSANVTATYDAAMPAISTTAPSRTGYTFVGWYDNADYASGTQYYSETGASARTWNKTANTTLYAGWTENGYDCKAGEYLNVTACKVCEAGYYCPNGAMTYTYNGEIQGRSSCPSGYTDGGTGLTTQTQCVMTVAGGKYVGTANSSTLSTCAAGTAKAAHTVNYGGTSSCDICANWTYSGEGAASCTSCPSVTSGWSKTDSTGTGWKSYTSCKQTQKPANCASGAVTKTATSSTQWGTSTVTTALTANANYYVAYTTCGACSGLANGFYPNSVAGNSGGSSVCYTDSLSGKYVATPKANGATDCAAGTFKGAHIVNYGGTSSCDVCADNNYSDAGASSCTACATPYGYGNTGTTAEEHAGRASCKTVCDAGMYVATAGAACENVGAGYYAPGGEVSYGSISKNRGQCPVQLTTIGYGYGANEADDCGRKLHAGDGVVYLRSAKKNPDELALNVRLNITNDNGALEERVFFGNMTTEEKFMSDGVTKALKINVDDTVYYVHDDSVM